MLLEAQASTNFGSFVVAEILPDLVEAVRANGNAVVVNIAHADGIEKRELTNINMLNPGDPEDRRQLLAAIGNADELATAIPSVDFYGAGGDSSIAALLAAGIEPDKPRILYASENNNYAAELLKREVVRLADPGDLSQFQVLDTVIGKMSGAIRDPAVIARLGLRPMVAGSDRALLVEEFNRIFVSRVSLPCFARGIEVFEEKEDLLPFEEAKLFGHNAIHALLGYLAHGKGYRVMSEIASDRALMDMGRRAFLDESGAALVRKHGATGETLFTPGGYEAYADDLLARMTNRFLNDEVERVCRDPGRKLDYGDRLVGTMREALEQGVEPILLARGAAAALRYAVDSGADFARPAADASPAGIRAALESVWGEETTDGLREECLRLIVEQSG